MRKPVTVVWDVDGVLADFCLGFTLLANELYGTQVLTSYECKTWGWSDGQGGLTKEVMDGTWKYIKHSSYYWQDLPPLATKKEFGGIEKMAQNNIMIPYFITARPGIHAQQQTAIFLTQHGITFPTVILAYPGVDMAPSSVKGGLCKYLGAQLAIDDNVGNIEDIAKNSPTIPFIRSLPYNEHYTCSTRVEDVTQFLDVVECLYEEGSR